MKLRKKMDQSERMHRLKENRYSNPIEADEMDEIFSDRIAKLLNNHKIDKFCLVDAYYYDFSVIPTSIQKELNLWSDCYLIFGITIDGEIISKWVDRWDLDFEDPIIEGNVIHNFKPLGELSVSDISQKYNPNLLSTPIPYLFNTTFKKVPEDKSSVSYFMSRMTQAEFDKLRE